MRLVCLTLEIKIYQFVKDINMPLQLKKEKKKERQISINTIDK
jgi:hypothetical protein